MKRAKIWMQSLRALIQDLCDSENAAARETGRIWKWAFEKTSEADRPWIAMQDPITQRDLLWEFLRINEECARNKGQEGVVTEASLCDKRLRAGYSLSDLPKTIQPSYEVAAALSAFGMFVGHKDWRCIDSLGRLPYTCALFDLPPRIFDDICRTKRLTDDERAVIMAVKRCFPTDPKRRKYFKRIELAAIVQSQFGFTHELITSTDVYQRGYSFYKSASAGEAGLSLTISNTSGLWNPHERLGTEEFHRRYGVKDGCTLKYKDAFRETNFTDGILNAGLACCRLYMFNDGSTWEAFRKARSAAKNVEAFDSDAIRFVEQTCSRMGGVSGALELVAIRNFAECDALPIVTRASHSVLMLSNRNPGATINHAFWCALESNGALPVLEGVLKTVADMATAGVFSKLVSLPPFMKVLYGTPECMRRWLKCNATETRSILSKTFKLKTDPLTPENLRKDFMINSGVSEAKYEKLKAQVAGLPTKSCGSCGHPV